jgi:hypothetical protein
VSKQEVSIILTEDDTVHRVSSKFAVQLISIFRMEEREGREREREQRERERERVS